MQIASSVSNRYYTPYQTNKSEKCFGGFSQIEAAEETGYNEGERMDYFSQGFIHQVENRQSGIANYTDVLGKSIASKLQSARESLYDFEKIEKLEGLTGATAVDTEETVDYAKILEEKRKEIGVKIKKGDTEPTYQIGSQSFTEKEWEEFLDKFDSVEEAIRELMKEEQARKEAEEVQKEAKPDRLQGMSGLLRLKTRNSMIK